MKVPARSPRMGEKQLKSPAPPDERARIIPFAAASTGQRNFTRYMNIARGIISCRENEEY